MRKKKSVSQRARDLIEQGHNNKDIMAQLKCKPQVVYNVRYQINKSKGLGALKQQGTGISVLATTPVWSPPAIMHPPKVLPITMIEPPTLWQRVKGWFSGTNA